MAGYRPIGLVAFGASTIHAGRASTYADRRRAAAERLSLAADLSVRLETAVGAPAAAPASDTSRADASTSEPAAAVIDPDGVLRAAIRALLPLAHRTDGLDLAVSLGPDHRWAARLTGGTNGLQVDLVPWSGPAPAPAPGPGAGPARPGPASGAPAADAPSEAEIAHDLAELVRAGEVGAR